ncbi:hypothetical protein SAMN05444695_12135 [Rhodococcus triatomae]|uniref:Uncharacterized protein n=1 Tax=Rhodococcus triatomae TaxID=300028 RepID=A0A1G8SG67_9NOCA|nr:hypothetical protein SAMN05444695_12135 [Rhodococcus triatomae]
MSGVSLEFLYQLFSFGSLVTIGDLVFNYAPTYNY